VAPTGLVLGFGHGVHLSGLVDTIVAAYAAALKGGMTVRLRWGDVAETAFAPESGLRLAVSSSRECVGAEAEIGARLNDAPQSADTAVAL
jgi:hypothetical protein